ncbi:MAG: adenylosuccinate synthase [Roseiflexaceae bacterium]
MAVVAVVGAQWGDEGKGHIVDILAARAATVIRYGGGNNAGHTVVNRHGTFKLHLVPAGIFEPTTRNIVGNGTVIDPKNFIAELDGLIQRGIDVGNLVISDRAHVVMPYHILQDKLDEQLRGDAKIGTTGRGIGPAYADKTARTGIRMADLVDADRLHQRLQTVLANKNRLFATYYASAGFDLDALHREYVAYGQRLAPYISDIHPIVQQALASTQSVLLEGAQGVMLDLDHGTYPYVTSSLPGIAGACQGAGIAPNAIDHVMGIFKAYTTRVGAGPFPSEVDGAAADALRQMGKPWAEVGTTTGRLRRVGWFDAVAARYATALNGIDLMTITKLDVLDEVAEIAICVGYTLDGRVIDAPPSQIEDYERVLPIYETMPGWLAPTHTARHWDELPANAQAYVRRLAEVCGATVSMVSVGPGHEQIIEVVSAL